MAPNSKRGRHIYGLATARRDATAATVPPLVLGDPATPVPVGETPPQPRISAISYFGHVGRAAISSVLEGAIRLSQRTGDRRVYVTGDVEEEPPVEADQGPQAPVEADLETEVEQAPMEVELEQPQPRSRPACASFRGLDLSLQQVLDVGFSLQNRGSHQYKSEVRMLLLRLVVQQMATWMLAVEHAGEHSDELQSQVSPSSVVHKGSPRESLMVVQLIPRKDCEPSWSAACEVVAARACVCIDNLRAWMMEYLWTGKLECTIRSRKVRLILTGSSVPPAYVLELLAVVHSNRIHGLTTNYKVLQAHANSTVRIHELCGIDVCPPLLISTTTRQQKFLGTLCGLRPL
jgi:hypothetical protein